MEWDIERNEKGQPVRMWWLGPHIRTIKTTDDSEPKHQPFIPAMREWARARGLMK